MKDCLFCKIARGEIPAFITYRDKDIIAFLDINPLAEGHTLIVPREHYENIFDVKEDILKKMIVAAKVMSSKLESALEAEGINLLNANKMAAGQSVQHFHLHVVPRKKGDGMKMNNWWQSKTKKISQERLKEIAQRLKMNNLKND